MPTTDGTSVHPSNRDQAQAWDGEQGAYWAGNADRFDRAVADYHAPFLEAAAVGAVDRVLDVGCGTGQATRDLARSAGAGSALGVDLSARMVEQARRLAATEGVRNVRFEQGDAQVHPFGDEPFDVAVSRTGGMFFGDPVAAYAHIGAALRPRGRLVLLTWQPPARNEWVVELFGAVAGGAPPAPPPGPGPFSLSDPDVVVAVLRSAGFHGIDMQPLAATTWFGADVEDAHRFVLGLFGSRLEGLDAASRAAAEARLRRSIETHDGADGVRYGSAAWLTVARREPRP